MADYVDIMDVPDSELPQPLPLPDIDKAQAAQPDAPDPSLPGGVSASTNAGERVVDANGSPLAGQAASFGSGNEDVLLALDRIAQVLERIEQIMA